MRLKINDEDYLVKNTTFAEMIRKIKEKRKIDMDDPTFDCMILDSNDKKLIFLENEDYDGFNKYEIHVNSDNRDMFSLK